MKELLTLIDNFIYSGIDYDVFYSKFNDLYCIEPSIFKESEEDFVSEINDKLAYTGKNPDSEDRKYGFVDADEFREWLKSYRQKNIQFWDDLEK